MTLERRAIHHAPDWYWAVGIIAVSIAATAYILDNILFAVFIVISTIVLFLRTLQKPREMTYSITQKGIWINKEFHGFRTLESFWIDDQEDPPLLLLKSKTLLMPLLSIPLEDVDHEALQAYLVLVLPEVEMHEPFSKRIMEYLGF
jgi:hypothetical protein